MTSRYSSLRNERSWGPWVDNGLAPRIDESGSTMGGDFIRGGPVPMPIGGIEGIRGWPGDPSRPVTPESGWYGPGGTGVPGQSQQPSFGPDNPFWEAFETDPQGQRANFLARLGGVRPGQRSFAESLFQPTFNRFLGQLGQQVISGQPPTQTFSDFLQNDFNLNRELLRMPQSSSRLFGRPQFFFGR